MNYQNQTLAVMNGVELIVALYDGMIRFLHAAIASVEAQNATGRRESIRRVLEILTHLQARLRADVGGASAATLAEFYAAMYAQCLRASRDASIPLLQQSIQDIRNVRDAWHQIAQGNPAATVQLHGLQGNSEQLAIQPNSFAPGSPLLRASLVDVEATSHRWSA
jgi:flagellar protein FliS